MKVELKQTLFDVPHADGKKRPVPGGSEVEVPDSVGEAMVSAGQAKEVAPAKAKTKDKPATGTAREGRPAKDTASKRAAKRETRGG